MASLLCSPKSWKAGVFRWPVGQWPGKLVHGKMAVCWVWGDSQGEVLQGRARARGGCLCSAVASALLCAAGVPPPTALAEGLAWGMKASRTKQTADPGGQAASMAPETWKRQSGRALVSPQEKFSRKINDALRDLYKRKLFGKEQETLGSAPPRLHICGLNLTPLC